MVKKFTLTVPDELAARIEPLRDRLKLSEIFQKAVLEQVSMHEALHKKVEWEVDDIVYRLQMENFGEEVSSYETGYSMGSSFYVNNASYSQFKDIESFKVPTYWKDLTDQIEHNSLANNIYVWISETEVITVHGNEKDIDASTAPNMKIHPVILSNIVGWYEGARDVWLKVKARLAEINAEKSGNNELQKELTNEPS